MISNIRYFEVQIYRINLNVSISINCNVKNTLTFRMYNHMNYNLHVNKLRDLTD